MNLKFFLVTVLFIPIRFLLCQDSIVSQHLDSSRSDTQLVLTGKVALDNDSALPQAAAVLLDCGASQKRVVANTDSKGNFTVTLNSGNQHESPRPDDQQPLASSSTPGSEVQNWHDCDAMAEIPGYVSERVRLVDKMSPGMVDVGRIALHPNAKQDTGSTVSVTALAAPEKAKADFDKGREQAKKGKWGAAIDSFRKAIAVYPRFALAWLELGRAQLKTNDVADAKTSFFQCVQHDSKLPDGYSELAQIALQEKQWKDVVYATDHLIELLPNQAQYWFLNAAAAFNMGNTAKAETGIRKAIALDTNHAVPQLEYLYGLVLARKQDYKAAVEHVSAYLRLAPNAHDSQLARGALEEFQRRAQSATR